MPREAVSASGHWNADRADLDLITVVLHELGHGLNFLSFVDAASGQTTRGDSACAQLGQWMIAAIIAVLRAGCPRRIPIAATIGAR